MVLTKKEVSAVAQLMTEDAITAAPTSVYGSLGFCTCLDSCMPA